MAKYGLDDSWVEGANDIPDADAKRLKKEAYERKLEKLREKAVEVRF